MAHRAADDAAQHVAALLVARHHAVGDEERHRAGVLGEDAQRDVGLGAGEAAVGRAGDLLGRGDQRPEHVDVPDRVDALEHREVALEAGAGVDARRRQRHQRAVGLRVELHEHEVPDLDEAVLAAVRRAAVGTELRPEVPEDLGARTAGAGVGHRQKLSSPRRWIRVARHADVVAPDRLGLVVGLVDRDPEAVGVEPEDLGVELPRERDRLGLEVVAEAEVARASRRTRSAGSCGRCRRGRCACRRPGRTSGSTSPAGTAPAPHR